MEIKAAEIERIEAAFDAVEARTAAPVVCVLARRSGASEYAFLLAASLIALAAPWPLLVLTLLSAERIFLIQLAAALVAALVLSLGAVRRLLTPRRIAQGAAHRAALAQFALRGLAGGGRGVLIYVSLEERYMRVIAADEAAAAIPRERWQGVVDKATPLLARGETTAALIGAAADCGALLQGAFPLRPGEAPRRRQNFHIA